MQHQPNTNTIFFGTSDFASIIIGKIIKHGHGINLKALICQPDRPAGRGKKTTPPPAKLTAEKHHLTIFQPEKIDKNFIQQLKTIPFDMFIVAAYGKILPADIIYLPTHHTLNIHPSLLPKYRGPSPIQTALLNNDKQTGVTIIELDEKMDHGNIVSQSNLNITPTDNFTSLSDKLAHLSAKLLIDTMPAYIKQNITPQPQQHDLASFTKLIQKEDGLITVNQDANTIYHMWRAYTPWPGIYTQLTLNDKKINIKLIDIELADKKHKQKSLKLFTQNNNLYLTCANHTTLKINSLQPQNKKTMSAHSFINGYLNQN